MANSDNLLARHNVRISGGGESTIVFAHGFGCDQNMWRFVAPAFEASHRVVLFDYLGMGRSDPRAFDPERYGSLGAYAEDVVTLCEALGLGNAIFVGHSVSGMIGALAAIQAPHLFERLVMVGPSPRYINDPEDDYVGGFDVADVQGLLEMMDRNYIGWANYLAPVAMKNPGMPALTEELEQSFCSTDPVVARRFAEATFYADNRADLARIPIPALILQCADDVIAPTVVGEYMHRNMPGSSLRHMVATGHCPHMSHPQETIDAIRDYLDTVAA